VFPEFRRKLSALSLNFYHSGSCLVIVAEDVRSRIASRLSHSATGWPPCDSPSFDSDNLGTAFLLCVDKGKGDDVAEAYRNDYGGKWHYGTCRWRKDYATLTSECFPCLSTRRLASPSRREWPSVSLAPKIWHMRSLRHRLKLSLRAQALNSVFSDQNCRNAAR